MSHAALFFDEVAQIVRDIDRGAIDRLASELAAVRERRGRLFLLGVGGSAGNCSHAVNDFRKLCGIEAYTPVDNVSELTARTNDEGWDTVFEGWLEVSNANEKDAILIFSVGGGDAEKNVSPNLVKAIDFAKKRGTKVFGVVGRATGYTARRGDVVVVIPAPNAAHITPHSEAFQAVVWHCLVSNPVLQRVHLGRVQDGHRPRHRLQIVEQRHAAQRECPRDLPRVHPPGHVGEIRRLVDDRTRHTEASRHDRARLDSRVVQQLRDHRRQLRVGERPEHARRDRPRPRAVRFEQSKQRLGSTDVSAEQHLDLNLKSEI